MGMVKCPVCGEKYSDTYRDCPFCEEEESLRRGSTSRRHSNGGRRKAPKRGKGPSLLSPILIVLIFLMLGLLIYLLFGDSIAEKIKSGSSGTSSSVSSSSQGTDLPGDVSTPDDVTDEPDSQPAPDTAVTLNKEDFTLQAGESYALIAAEGGDTYTWESDDPGVASVSETGVVTAISAGNANITVTDGYTTATCIVRVKGVAPAGTGSGDGGTASGTAALNRTDFTLGKGESFILTISGTSSKVTWDVDNSTVASVTEDGKVTGKSAGTTEITAKVDGKILKCIVRVK